MGKIIKIVAIALFYVVLDLFYKIGIKDEPFSLKLFLECFVRSLMLSIIVTMAIKTKNK